MVMSITGHQVRGSLPAHKYLSHFAQLVLVLLRYNLMNSKAILGVTDQTEILSSLVNADDIHKTSRVCYINQDFAINLNEPLHANFLYFPSQHVLKPVPYGNDERETFSQLTGTGVWTRNKNISQFIQYPMLWTCYLLQMQKQELWLNYEWKEWELTFVFAFKTQLP